MPLPQTTISDPLSPSSLPDSVPVASASIFASQTLPIPAVGLGTFSLPTPSVSTTIHAALRLGYRHIDTAAAYGNEAEIGRALRESKVPREELWVTSKLAQTWHNPADVNEALQRSLHDLQLDYVDLYLMHFPYAYVTEEGTDHSTLRHASGNGKPVIDYELSRAYPKVWKAMEALVDCGRVRAIGLSNFNVLKTKRILEVARIRPVVNQVELHPFLPQHELLEFCKQEGIHLMAHQPLGGKPLAIVSPNAARSGPLSDPQIIAIASECEKSPAQVLLSWAVQRGTSVIPKTVREFRLAENLAVFRLSQEHFHTINTLAGRTSTVRYLDPSNHIGFDVFNEQCDEPVMSSAPWDQSSTKT